MIAVNAFQGRVKSSFKDLKDTAALDDAAGLVQAQGRLRPG